MRPVAEAAGLTVAGLAWGIHDLVNENMANAARVHLAEHGKDPRRYALLATGGAGPVHAYYVAKKLGLTRLIVPYAAGVASALGLLLAPARADRVATVARALDQIDFADLEATFQRLEMRRQGRVGGDRPEFDVRDDPPARRYPLRRPGLRAGGAAPLRSLHLRLAGRFAAGVRGELP